MTTGGAAAAAGGPEATTAAIVRGMVVVEVAAAGFDAGVKNGVKLRWSVLDCDAGVAVEGADPDDASRSGEAPRRRSSLGWRVAGEI